MRPSTDLRLFVAFELEPEVRAAVESAARELRRAVSDRLKAGGAAGNPLKWVAAENLHLTLKFLGEVPMHVMADIDAALRQAAARGAPTGFTVGGAGAFPTTGKPRVLWLGVETDERAVKRLIGALDDALAPIGFARETRPFSAHLTVARVRDATPAEEVRLIGEAVQRRRVGELGRQEANRLALIRSELFPTGPRYTRLAEYELGTGQASYPPPVDDETAAPAPDPAESAEAGRPR